MPSDGKIAEVPNAEADCFWHSVQWHANLLRGSAREAVREMVPHWQVIFGFSPKFDGLLEWLRIDVDENGYVIPLE